jgi:hypothetical protein
MDFKEGASFWNDVMFSTKNNRFKGRTTIILSSKLTPLMEKHEIIIPRRFLNFQIILYYNVGIMCIYEQNNTIRCARLWKTLTYVP